MLDIARGAQQDLITALPLSGVAIQSETRGADMLNLTVYNGNPACDGLSRAATQTSVARRGVRQTGHSQPPQQHLAITRSYHTSDAFHCHRDSGDEEKLVTAGAAATHGRPPRCSTTAVAQPDSSSVGSQQGNTRHHWLHMAW